MPSSAAARRRLLLLFCRASRRRANSASCRTASSVTRAGTCARARVLFENSLGFPAQIIGQIVAKDGCRRAKSHRTLDHVAQLADVARPVVANQGVEGLRYYAVHRAGVVGRKVGQELLSQCGNDLGLLPQRRQVEPDHVQPVIQVGAKRPAATSWSRWLLLATIRRA